MDENRGKEQHRDALFTMRCLFFDLYGGVSQTLVLVVVSSTMPLVRECAYFQLTTNHSGVSSVCVFPAFKFFYQR